LEVQWTYKEKLVLSHSDLLQGCTDFVYELVFKDKTKYIGKKCVRSMRRLKPTKEQLAIRKNYKRVELKDVPFLKYVGSSKENDGKTLVSKTILYQSSSKKTSTYIEAALLFENDVLFNDTFNNICISGVYWNNSLDGLLDKEEEK